MGLLILWLIIRSVLLKIRKFWRSILWLLKNLCYGIRFLTHRYRTNIFMKLEWVDWYQGSDLEAVTTVEQNCESGSQGYNQLLRRKWKRWTLSELYGFVCQGFRIWFLLKVVTWGSIYDEIDMIYMIKEQNRTNLIYINLYMRIWTG